MSARLFIGNLPYTVTENDLQNHFAQAGAVISVKIMLDRMTGKSRGFGFVEMTSAEEAQKAISLLHKQELQGRPLTVDSAKPLEDRSGQTGSQQSNRPSV
jgi:cold-inducible RNA-binding protein